MKDKIEFDVELVSPDDYPNSTAITCPFNVLEVFGSKARIPVKITVDGHSFRSSLAPMGGCHMMVFNKEMREKTGYKGGDTIRIFMERDTEPRTVDIPDDVLVTLKQNETAYRVFLNYSYSRQKEVIEWINDAKKPETRQKRISKLMESVSK